MIKGKRIILRTTQQEDIDECVRLANDFSQVGEYWPVGLWSKSEFAKKFAETGFWGENEGWLMITTHDGRMVGSIGFFKFMHYAEGFEIGYRIFRKEDRGKGYMTEALRIFTAYLFALKPISRVQVNLLKGNTASRRVAENCGFTHDGTLRKLTFQRGVFHDLEMFSLLREECPTLAEVLGESWK